MFLCSGCYKEVMTIDWLKEQEYIVSQFWRSPKIKVLIGLVPSEGYKASLIGL